MSASDEAIPATASATPGAPVSAAVGGAPVAAWGVPGGCEFHTIVIGAGLAGLSCAHALGEGCLVVEREARVGGLARTRRAAGFLFDCTAHWLHVKDPQVQALVTRLLGDDLVTVERRAAIFAFGRTVAYPFQASTHGLPPAIVADCLLGFFRAREAMLRGEQQEPRNFEEFIRQRLGDGIAEHFMIPYNTKLWTLPPAAMDHRWCERFVPIPSAEEVVLGALRPGGAGRAFGYNATFSYPRSGGMGTLADALRAAVRAPVLLGQSVVAVDWRRRVVTLSDGRRLHYRTLVSTTPLPDLIAALHEPPAAIAAAAKALRATSVTYWDIGLARSHRGDADAHWTYFADAAVPFYRVSAPSAAAPWVAPQGGRTLCAEVAHRRGIACAVTAAQVLEGLRRVGLLAADEEPVVVEQRQIDCAYVLMDHAYAAARGRLLDWLDTIGVLSIGRYGAWKYDSMEGAIRDGLQAAAQLHARGASLPPISERIPS